VSPANFSAAPSITIDHDTRRALAYSVPQDNCGARKIVSSRCMAPRTTARSTSLAAGSFLNEGHITPGLRYSPLLLNSRVRARAVLGQLKTLCLSARGKMQFLLNQPQHAAHRRMARL
jgi:hypothetical protein